MFSKKGNIYKMYSESEVKEIVKINNIIVLTIMSCIFCSLLIISYSYNKTNVVEKQISINVEK